MSDTQHNRPPSPWFEFFSEVDATISNAVELHCVGGFVISMCYGLPRPTADVDVLSIPPLDRYEELSRIAGQGSGLHKKHGVYVQVVGVAPIPEDYESRLNEMFPRCFEHLRLLSLDHYDLALTKIERNSARDREDVKFLAKAVPLDPAKLRERYENELRAQLGNPEREDLTLKLWLEMAFPTGSPTK